MQGKETEQRISNCGTICGERFVTFSDISQIALQRQNEAIDIIKSIDWKLDDEDHTLHYIFPPSLHLVKAAWKEVQRTAQDFGLCAIRKRMTEAEVKAFYPKITRKSGGYLVCISNDEEAAKMAIKRVKDDLAGASATSSLSASSS